MAITGKATPEATHAFRSRFRALAAAELGTTGLAISKAGFGGYRIAADEPVDREALLRALRSGINVIDTSANYGNGQSEVLIGEILAELIDDEALEREAVVVVSKAGYVQGQNITIAKAREAEGQPFPEMVKLEDGLWHCLHPEFLADQLTRSLERLGLASLDVYLLHNPEYFLKSKGPHPTDADRQEYERRLQLAFRHLETEVAAGRIGCYGISSNTFPEPADSPAFTSLSRSWELANAIRPDHHFRVIQFPGNLYERGFVLEANQPGGQTVLAFANQHDLGVLINRPLNAFHGNRLIRLAEVPPGKAVDSATLHRLIEEIGQAETELLGSDWYDPAHATHLSRWLVIGDLLTTNLPYITGREQWQEIVNYHVLPRVERALHLLSHQSNPALGAWQSRYEAALRHALQALESNFRHLAEARTQALHAAIDPLLDDAHRRLSLSQQAITLLRSLPGVDVVLVGMRSEAYVDDVLGALSIPPVAEAMQVWQRLQLP